MALPEVPNAFPDWATDTQTNPISGQPNYSAPPSVKQQYGWAYNEIPPRQWFNWWMRYVGLWIRYFFSTVQEVVEHVGADGNYAATSGQLKVLADTITSGYTHTLPSSPNIGDETVFIDVSNTFSINYVTVERNGNLINGGTEDVFVDEGNTKFVFVGGSFGWRVY